MRRSLARLALSLFVCAGLHSVQAQTPLFDQVHTIAAATVAVPVEHTFTIDTAGDYNITLTDLGAQYTPSAPLASVELAVTGNDVLVGTPLVGAGTLVLKSLQPGTYQYHVTGMPGTVAGSGPFGVQVVSTAGGAAIAANSDTLALPAGTVSNDQAVLDATFTVSAAGSYQVSLTDLNLPASLSTLTLALVPAGGSAPLAILPDPTTGSYQATVQLTTGVNYRLFAAAQASSTANAGLFSAAVTPAGGGASVYQATQPVGAFTSLGSTPTLNSGTYTVTLTDLATPAALTGLVGVLTQNGSATITVPSAGAQNFNSAGGVYQVFALGTPAASPGTGSYALTVQPQGGSPVMSVAQAVAASGTTSSAYSFNTTVTSGGSYALNLADFTFPKQFGSLSAVAVQNGAILGTPLNAAGTATVTPVAGQVSLLVFAKGDPSGSLFGLDLTPSVGGDPLFATTQGVGQLFSSQIINVTTGGTYTAAVSDLAFPAQFASLAAIVTQGSQQFGQIYQGGAFQFTASPGSYFVTFVAQPNTTYEAGTYALNVSLVPVVQFQSSASSVASGGTVTLQWDSQNTTACVASGGWSGSEPVSGTATSPAINIATTFTLTCSGPGGSTAQSVTVTVTAPKKSGGGGALDIEVALFLAGVVMLQLIGRRATR